MDDLLLHYKVDRDVLRLKMNYLEKVAQGFANTEKWESFIDILALLIFGIVIFPNIGNIVDSIAINEFWAVNNQKVDLIYALLADIYYTLNICHDKKRGPLHSCIPILYQ